MPPQTPQTPAREASRPAGGDTVTVACKMPHGIILRVFSMEKAGEPQRDGGVKEVDMAEERGRFTVAGYLEKYDPQLPPAARGSSYALTHGVPRELWETWLAQNKDSDLVRNRLIFASDADRVADRVRDSDHAATRCGLEPIDQKRLPKNISTYSQADRDGAVA